MNDWGMSVIDMYPVTMRSARKIRGALLCDAKEGLFLLQEYRGKEERLKEEARMLAYLDESTTIHTDRIIKNKQEALLTKNDEGTGYVLKIWYPWQECNANSVSDLGQAISVLARLHVYLRHMPNEESEDEKASETADKEKALKTHDLYSLYAKHNRELRRVRTYLAQKRKKSCIEQLIQKSFKEIYEQAESVENELKACGLQMLEEDAKNKGHIVHGAYHQHNVLIGQGQTAVINFEQFHVGCQVADLYQFLRKIMEKHNWDKELGRRLIDEYCRIQNLSGEELKLLKLMTAYPEKYWKQVNFYFNNNKSWISEKNIEKIKKAVEQNSVRTAFANSII